MFPSPVFYIMSIFLFADTCAQLTSGNSYRLTSILQGACRSLSEPNPTSIEPQMAKTEHVLAQIWTFTSHTTKPELYKITAPSGRFLKMEPGFNPDLNDPPTNGNKRRPRPIKGTTLAPEPGTGTYNISSLKWMRNQLTFLAGSKGAFSTSPNNYAPPRLILTNNTAGGDENLFYWRLQPTGEGSYRLVNARVTGQDTDKSLGVRKATGSAAEALEDVDYEGTVWMITPAEKENEGPCSFMDPK